MPVSYDDLDVLLEVQRIDMEVMQAKKTRASLPQRIQVVKIRKKRDEISPKLQQIVDLQAATEAKATKIEDEDRSLAQKQERAQEIITAAGSDFRKAESHSKDMAGVAKRRSALEEELNKLNAEIDKMKSVRKQLEDAIAACDAEEASLKASYQEKDAELIAKAQELLDQRSKLVAGLPQDLVATYDKTAKKTGGVALGHLEEGGTCSACRTTISGGRLIALQNQAPIGVCPNCNRMLIIQQ